MSGSIPVWMQFHLTLMVFCPLFFTLLGIPGISAEGESRVLLNEASGMGWWVEVHGYTMHPGST